MNTEEGNKLIAEFMGASFPELDKSVLAFILSEQRFPDNMYRCKIADLNYHTSWDWLMPVYLKYKKIREENDTRWSFNEEMPLWGKHKGLIQSTLLLGDITKFHNALVEFIQWYNKIKHP